MSVLTYTALREIEPNGYVKTGTDISAAAGDDSFNSTSTSLTGLPDNDFVLVSGFANAANNGWFQANGASVLHKITQDTTTSLVTEAAGPAITITGYKRGLGLSYSLEFYSDKGDRSVKVKRSSAQAMGGGAPEVLLYRREAYLDVSVLGPLGALLTDAPSLYPLAGNLLQYREFLASVEGGEIFTFDQYGTIAVPDVVRQAMLSSEDYAEVRVGPTRLYTIAMQLRMLT